MNRKMTQMLQPSFQLYFVCLILFAAASAFFSLYLAAAEAVVVVLLGLYYREGFPSITGRTAAGGGGR